MPLQPRPKTYRLTQSLEEARCEFRKIRPGDLCNPFIQRRVHVARRLVFTGKHQVKVETFEPKKVEAGMVAVRSLYSLISTGTEMTIFNRNFDGGTPWEEWVKYPFYPGYANCGQVEKVGKGVKSVKPGDRVVTQRGHASMHVAPEEQCLVLPEEADAKTAPWFVLAKIAFMGAKAAPYAMGDHMLVIGAGPIGQMTVRWACAYGVETIIVVDMVAARLKLAQMGGATHVIAKPLSECMDEVKTANDGELPTLVVDTTGNHVVFAQALAACAPRGRMVLLGDTGTPDKQHLTADVIQKGLKIIGAHSQHMDPPWTLHRIHRLFFGLLATGRFDVAGLNTHTFKPHQSQEAYRLLNECRGETMGVIFDWTSA